MKIRYPRLGPLGTHTSGRVDQHDQGDLALALSVDYRNKIVRIEFGTDVTWLGMEAHQAREFGNALLRAAKALEDGD